MSLVSVTMRNKQSDVDGRLSISLHVPEGSCGKELFILIYFFMSVFQSDFVLPR